MPREFDDSVKRGSGRSEIAIEGMAADWKRAGRLVRCAPTEDSSSTASFHP